MLNKELSQLVAEVTHSLDLIGKYETDDAKKAFEEIGLHLKVVAEVDFWNDIKNGISEKFAGKIGAEIF